MYFNAAREGLLAQVLNLQYFEKLPGNYLAVFVLVGMLHLLALSPGPFRGIALIRRANDNNGLLAQRVSINPTLGPGHEQ